MDRSTYPIHCDLLAQVATSEEEDREVRRILSAPLTVADLDAQERYKRAPFPIGATNHAHRHSRPACSRCESGLAHCVTPAACELAERPDPPMQAGDLVRVWGLFLAGWAVVVLVGLIVMGV